MNVEFPIVIGIGFPEDASRTGIRHKFQASP